MLFHWDTLIIALHVPTCCFSSYAPILSERCHHPLSWPNQKSKSVLGSTFTRKVSSVLSPSCLTSQFPLIFSAQPQAQALTIPPLITAWVLPAGFPLSFHSHALANLQGDLFTMQSWLHHYTILNPLRRLPREFSQKNKWIVHGV